jgi:hypothetical protein
MQARVRRPVLGHGHGWGVLAPNGGEPQIASVAHRIETIPAPDPPARRLRSGLLLGAATGALATVAIALASPDLYIDWGLLPGVLLVIPLASMGLTALVALPLAALRRLTWGAAVAAVLTALVVGELIFLGSQGTAFARWSASRHWAATARRAAAEREATERETCRRALAEAPAPPPPVPGAPRRGSLVLLDRERCAELLGR